MYNNDCLNSTISNNQGLDLYASACFFLLRPNKVLVRNVYDLYFSDENGTIFVLHIMFIIIFLHI